MSELNDPEQTYTPPETPERRRPGRKPGQQYGAKPEGPMRTVSMNPRAGGMTLVEIKMELPLALAIELAQAAADVQTKADGAEPVRVGQFPRVGRQ